MAGDADPSGSAGGEEGFAHVSPAQIAAAMRVGLRECLEQATALVPAQLFADSKRYGEQVRQCDEEGNYAFWMDGLFRIGALAEEWGRDAELPPAFWHNLAEAAGKMRFPQFIPQARGKAEGRPRRSLGHYLAAIVVIHREVGVYWAPCFPDQPALLDEFVAQFAAVDPDYPALFRTENSDALAKRFEADGWLDDAGPDSFFAVRQSVTDVFDPLFAFIHGDGFPDALADERWSVVGFNAFEVRLIDGLFPGTEARPWWA